MKKLYIKLITLIFIAISISAKAQPTLNGSDVNPIIGQSIITHSYNYPSLVPGNGGAGVTWNYAGIGNNGSITVNNLAPSSTPYSSQFANANTAFVYQGFGVYQYYLCNASEYSHYGDVANGTVIPFSNRETVFTYPCTFNSTGSDNFYSTFTSSGYTYYRYGTSTFIADGYGTLILPYGTFTNVLRVKFVEDYLDSVNVGGSPIIANYHNDEYIWMKAGTHAFLLEYYTIVAGGNPTSSGYYLDQSNVGITENTDDHFSYSVFPNPATDFVQVKYEIKYKSYIELKMFNSLGQNIKTVVSDEQTPGVYTREISLKNLAKGIYTIQLSTGGYLENKKIIVN